MLFSIGNRLNNILRNPKYHDIKFQISVPVTKKNKSGVVTTQPILIDVHIEHKVIEGLDQYNNISGSIYLTIPNGKTNNMHPDEHCVKLILSNNTIDLSKLLYELSDSNYCKKIPGYVYLNLIFSIAKVYIRNINRDIEEITLQDAAKFRLTGNSRLDVSATSVQCFEKQRSFYEGYGFLPSFSNIRNMQINNTGEEIDEEYDVNSPEYTNILDVYLRDRKLFLTTPINILETIVNDAYPQLFTYNGMIIMDEGYELNSYRLENLKHIYQNFIRRIEADYKAKHNITDGLTLSQLYASLKNNSGMQYQLVKLFDDNGYKYIFPNNYYTYPVISRHQKEAIAAIYTKHEIDFKVDYFMFITSDNISDDTEVNTSNNRLKLHTNRILRRTKKANVRQSWNRRGSDSENENEYEIIKMQNEVNSNMSEIENMQSESSSESSSENENENEPRLLLSAPISGRPILRAGQRTQRTQRRLSQHTGPRMPGLYNTRKAERSTSVAPRTTGKAPRKHGKSPRTKQTPVASVQPVQELVDPYYGGDNYQQYSEVAQGPVDPYYGGGNIPYPEEYEQGIALPPQNNYHPRSLPQLNIPGFSFT